MQGTSLNVTTNVDINYFS